MDEREYEQSGSAVLMWALWGGLTLATVGEVVLFVFMDPAGTHGAEAVGSLPMSQLIIVAVLAVVMVALAAGATWGRVGGGGFPAAMISWVLLKGVAISGLVVYQLAHDHSYYWPFLALFLVGMLALNPHVYEAGADAEA